MKTTTINPQSQYWAIIKRADPKGYHTGFKFSSIDLFEFVDAEEMDSFISDGSVESGESGSDYIFKVLGRSHSYQELEAEIRYMKELQEEDHYRELEAMEEAQREAISRENEYYG